MQSPSAMKRLLTSGSQQQQQQQQQQGKPRRGRVDARGKLFIVITGLGAASGTLSVILGHELAVRPPGGRAQLPTTTTTTTPSSTSAPQDTKTES